MWNQSPEFQAAHIGLICKPHNNSDASKLQALWLSSKIVPVCSDAIHRYIGKHGD